MLFDDLICSPNTWMITALNVWRWGTWLCTLRGQVQMLLKHVVALGTKTNLNAKRAIWMPPPSQEQHEETIRNRNARQRSRIIKNASSCSVAPCNVSSINTSTLTAPTTVDAVSHLGSQDHDNDRTSCHYLYPPHVCWHCPTPFDSQQHDI